jgi:outer membrane protein
VRILKLLFVVAGCLPCAGQTNIHVLEKPVGLLEALQSTLEKHPNIQVEERTLDYNRGALRIASGAFDRIYLANASQSYTNTPLTKEEVATYPSSIPVPSNQEVDATGFQVGVQQLFRNGILFEPVAQVNRQAGNLTDVIGADANGLLTTGVNTSNIALQVTIPLLKGRGQEVVTARERAAKFTVDATVLDLNNTISQLLATTAGQYWTVVAAARDVEIARSSEERGVSYANDVQTLIEADRVARSEINNVRANVAERISNRIAAEERLLQAEQSLALAMGLGVMEITRFPVATDPLPDWTAENAPGITPQLVQTFVDRALNNRADLLAADQRQRGAGVLIPAAKNQLRPQLDLSFSLGYQGQLEGKDYFRVFGAPFLNVGGPTAIANLKYSFAPKNNVAHGALEQAQASLQQAQIQKADVSRNVASTVLSAMVTLSDAVAKLQRARNAVDAYRLGLNGEQEKFRLGLSSVVDVLTIEDRLTTALSTENAARLDYAVAIINLRYATGTLIDPKATTYQLKQELFTKPPFEWEQL